MKTLLDIQDTIFAVAGYLVARKEQRDGGHYESCGCGLCHAEALAHKEVERQIDSLINQIRTDKLKQQIKK